MTVVAGQRAYDDPETLFPPSGTWQDVKIRRVPSLGLGKSIKWKRVVDGLSFSMLCGARLPWFERQDVVVSLTSPPLISVVGLVAARLHKCRFVHWTMDLNPDEAVAAGWLAKGSFSERLLEQLSRISLRGADRVIALDEEMAALIRSKGVQPDKISIVPPWSHTPDVRFDAEGRDRFRRQHGLERNFVVMYSGNHTPCHPLNTVIEAAHRLAPDPGISFCFVGGGTEFRKLRASLRNGTRRQLPNVVCLPYQPRNELSAVLSAADAHTVVMGNSMVGTVHPCKIYNLLHIGMPILYVGPRSSAAYRVVAGTPSGSRFAHGDADGLAARILELRAAAGRSPRPVQFPSASRFSQETILPRLIELLELPSIV